MRKTKGSATIQYISGQTRFRRRLACCCHRTVIVWTARAHESIIKCREFVLGCLQGLVESQDSGEVSIERIGGHGKGGELGKDSKPVPVLHILNNLNDVEPVMDIEVDWWCRAT